jgi:putative endonuclease
LLRHVPHRYEPSGRPARRSSSPSSDRRRLVGRAGEDLAAAHFAALGYRVLARNARTRHGEIDLVAFDGATLVFAEVKTRTVSRSVRELPSLHEPLAGLRVRQRVRVRALALAWLSSERSRGSGPARPVAREIRFDAVGVILDADGAILRLDHLEGAW